MSLLLNILSRLVITFLPRSKRLLIWWLQSPSAVIQYCIGFAIHWHESATGVRVPNHEPPLPPPTPYHLSGSSPCTSPKHPVSCIKHRLAIRFLHDSILISMPFSQIIPPCPSESKSPLYTSVSLLLSRIEGHHYHLSKFHVYVSISLIGISLTYFTLYNRLQFHPPH